MHLFMIRSYRSTSLSLTAPQQAGKAQPLLCTGLGNYFLAVQALCNRPRNGIAGSVEEGVATDEYTIGET